MNTLLETIPDRADETFFCGHGTRSLGRILVADDDEDLRYLLGELLRISGYEVDDAENGARAWKALHLKQYDLLVTDNEMPEMTGLQLVEKLRSAGFELPVIFASGRVPTDLAAKKDQLRLFATLPKPFSVDELTSTIKRALPARTPDFHTNLWRPSPNLAPRQKSYATQ